MVNKVWCLLLTISSLFILYNCETEVDLNADYEDITIVYGILDPSQDTQFIKINRSVNSNDPFVNARISDSSIYANLTADIAEMDVNGNTLNTYPLSEKYVTDINNGLFYSDYQKVYYFVAPLDPDNTYKLNVDINNGQKFVSAQTPVVDSVRYNGVFSNPPTLSLINGLGSYNTIRARWFSVAGSQRYFLSATFNYEEFTNSGSENKSILMELGNIATTSRNAGQAITLEISGERFYQIIASQIAADANVTKRVYRGIGFIVRSAEEELETYIEINRPISNISNVRPEYTNVENGLGIFSSRNASRLANKGLNSPSLQELATGQHTNGLGFCTDDIIFSSEPFYCP